MTAFKCAPAPPTGLFRLTASKSTTLPRLNGNSIVPGANRRIRSGGPFGVPCRHAEEHAPARVRDRPALDRPALDPRLETDALGVHPGRRLGGRGPRGDL